VASFPDANIVYEETLPGSDIYERSVDLSAYVGEVIYLAFVHYESTDWFRINLDNIVVLAGTSGGQSTEADILTFALVEVPAAVVVIEGLDISVTVAQGTDVTALTPTITISEGATIVPTPPYSAMDFTNPVQFVVTAEDGETTQTYTVTVEEEQEETFTVTFNVDMQYAEFDPAVDVVYITGSLLDWAEPGTDVENQTMSRVGETMIWTKTLELEAGTYAYKFFLNAGWDNGEWTGDPNREAVVEADVTFDDIFGWKTNAAIDVLSNLNVYPNPFTNEIFVENAENVSRVVITNVIGQVVVDMPVNSTSKTINTTNLNNGVYLVTFQANNGERLVRKMIKQ
jgi:hypothetical protein